MNTDEDYTNQARQFISIGMYWFSENDLQNLRFLKCFVFFPLFLYHVLPHWKLRRRDYVISPFQIFFGLLEILGRVSPTEKQASLGIHHFKQSGLLNILVKLENWTQLGRYTVSNKYHRAKGHDVHLSRNIKMTS